MTDAEKVYEEWLSDPYFDEDTKRELRDIAGDEKEITDRFYRSLTFGTGGLRGVIGAGTNRMNIYTVRLATQGLANYIISQGGQEKGVAIAYDSRRMSPEFSMEAALVLNANGIRTYRFDSLRPTPELSYAVRYLHCIAGIVVTASHNPREYNGYKVYWEDGAQITPPHDRNILEEVGRVTSFAEVKTMSRVDAEEAGLYHTIGQEIDDAYISEIRSLSIHPDVIRAQASSFKIAYTPLHGTGNIPVCRVLRELGFTQVFVEPSQEIADGNFPTVAYPNPEDPKAWELVLKLAEEKDADIVLATDPDADRLGVYAKDAKTGEYRSFTGNMSGILIAEYILREKKKLGIMPERPALIETIVSTDMAKPLAREYNTDIIEVLTGFKYIGEQIKKFEETGENSYVFGFEESYGCLPGTYARDKDACAAVMMLCEAAAFYKAEGKTLCDAMEDLYRKYGYYKEGLTSIEWKGAEGSELIKALMEDLRSAPADRIGGCEVLAVRDYASGVRTELAEQSRTPTGLPKSDVLYYELSGNAWCCVRPSGTEPKIKFYYGVCGKNANDADERLERLCKDLMDLTKKKPAFVPNLRLHGRIDRQAVRKEGGFPLFWAGSGAEFLFTGTDLSLDLQASFTKMEPWIAAELNGAPIIRMPLSRGINRISLLRGMTPGVAKHIRLFKETQPVFEDDEHFLCLTAIHADGGEFLPLPDSRYRLEFVGDSLTSGEGVIGARSETDWVPALFSASRTWARMASDLIGADFHVISQSGWGIRSGWENDPGHALPKYYSQVCGISKSPEGKKYGSDRKYDFSDWQADAVIINLGANDVGAMDSPEWTGEDGETFCQRNTPESLLLLENAVFSFLSEIRSMNPHAKIVWAYGMLGEMLSLQIKNAIDRYRRENNDPNVWYLSLPQATEETMGSREHPGYACHEAAARVTAGLLREILNCKDTDNN